ncbi:hypothetical protein OIV83_004947 [Microbotryomycetes sp. JL201]|nr:hypothetical protein OIV83_004947 [Microbotryomycetes sp. JL201]
MNEVEASQSKPDFVAPPPKNASERREWDRMSQRMQGFHNYFRQQFQFAMQSAEKVGSNEDFDVDYYLWQVKDLLRHLEMHHNIEERYIFPILAKKMPEFDATHPDEHKEIHAGMDRTEAYIKRVEKSPSLFSASEMRDILSSWGFVLFHHLDAEVASLKADNLRRYWTLDEVRRLPM